MTKDPDRNRMWAWIVGFIFLALVLLGVVIWVPKWQLSGLGCVSLVKRSEVENDYRRTIVQALGGLGALLLIWIGWKNFELTRRGQNTERFSRAIDQLGATDKDGNPQLEVRLGGIYALDQLARQVPGEYRQTVVNVLTAYLRENSKHAAPKA